MSTQTTTEWLMDDEEQYLDLLELYEEARADVDRKYPRVGDRQTRMIYVFGLRRWIDNNLFMETLAKQVRGEWWERNEHR